MSLRVVSYNTFGIFYAQLRAKRAEAMGPPLAPYDIVCLQEQFHDGELSSIQKGCPELSFVNKVRRSPITGPGLVVLSRFPIVSHTFKPFSAVAPAGRVFEGDYWGYKGIQVVQVTVPPHVLNKEGTEETITLLNLHAVAAYATLTSFEAWCNHLHTPWRVTQMIELFELISVLDSSRVILCGDFNSSGWNVELTLLRALCALHPHTGTLIPALSPVRADGQMTCAADNRFNRGDGSGGSYLTFMGMNITQSAQLDHVMILSKYDAQDTLYFSEKTKIKLTEECIADSSRRLWPLSDHYAVVATIGLRNKGPVMELKQRPEHLETLRTVHDMLSRRVIGIERQRLVGPLILLSTILISYFVSRYWWLVWLLGILGTVALQCWWLIADSHALVMRESLRVMESLSKN